MLLPIWMTCGIPPPFGSILWGTIYDGIYGTNCRCGSRSYRNNLHVLYPASRSQFKAGSYQSKHGFRDNIGTLLSIDNRNPWLFLRIESRELRVIRQNHHQLKAIADTDDATVSPEEFGLSLLGYSFFKIEG